MSTEVINQKLKQFEAKYNELKKSASNDVLSEIDKALKGISVSLEEAKNQSGEEANITIGSLMESVQEIEEYLKSL